MKGKISKAAIAGIIIVIVVIALAAYFLTAPPPAPPATPTPTPTPTPKVAGVLKIGVIMELTGELARSGQVCKRGYDVWYHVVKEKHGGLITINEKLYKVEVKFYDTKSDPAQAAAAVEKAVAEGMDLLLGPYSSANTLGAIPVADKYGIPFFCGSPESHLIPEKRSPWTFQTLITTKESPIPLVNFVSKYPVKTAAIISSNDAFSQGLRMTFLKLLKEKGMEVLMDEVFPVDITDLKPLISKAKALNPDIFIVSGHPTHHILAVKASKELDFNPKVFIVHYGVDSGDFLEAVADVAEGVTGLAFWTPEAAKRVNWKDPIFGDVKSFLDAWDKLFPGIYTDYTAAGCAATASYAVVLIQKLGIEPPFDSKEREMIRKAAETTSIETILGPIKYSTEAEHWHVNTELLGHVLVVQIHNGKLYVVYPEEAKEMNFMFPKPSWR